MQQALRCCQHATTTIDLDGTALAPVHAADLAGVIADDECRTVVTNPTIVGGDVDNLDVRSAPEAEVALSCGVTRCHDSNGCALGDQSSETIKESRDRVEPSRPGLAIVWPGKPDARLGFPLGRDPAANRCGR